MGEYLDIGGHPTWVVDQGTAPKPCCCCTVACPTPRICSAPSASRCRSAIGLWPSTGRGHGRTKDTNAAAFHYDDMATETVAVLESVVRGPAHLVGWSDGGIIALLLAIRRPDLVSKIVTIGANYHHDGIVMAPLPSDSPEIAMLASSYAERSPDGADHFPEVLRKSFTMFETEPELTIADLAQIAAPALVMSGDDEVVRSRAHAVAVPGASRRTARGRPRHLARPPAREAGGDSAAGARLPRRHGTAGDVHASAAARAIRLTLASADREPRVATWGTDVGHVDVRHHRARRPLAHPHRRVHRPRSPPLRARPRPRRRCDSRSSPVTPSISAWLRQLSRYQTPCTRPETITRRRTTTTSAAPELERRAVAGAREGQRDLAATLSCGRVRRAHDVEHGAPERARPSAVPIRPRTRRGTPRAGPM